MQIDKDVYVPMRDGVSLAVDLYRPDELTVHAAVLLVTPYLKDAVFAMPLGSDGRPVPLPLPPMPPGVNPMLLSVAPLVAQGFVVVVADARGTGYSEGVYDYYNFHGGPFDGYDTVEWIAAQPWCDGNVGMLGGSAAAISCYITALTQPPHLKAMVPNMHPADFYFDQWRIGGVFRYENRISWSTGMHSRISPVDPGPPDSPSYERKRAVYEQRFDQFYQRVAAGLNPANLDWLTEMYQRDRYDDFWQSRSFLARSDEIRIPTLHGGVWYDHFIRGTLSSHAAIDVPKRLFVGPGSLITRFDLGDGGLMAMTIAWFDHYLRGADNAVMEGPDARLYLLGLDDFIDCEQWPVATTDTELFLSSASSGSAPSINDGSMGTSAPPERSDPTVLVHDPAQPVRTPRDLQDQRSFEASCLTFTTAPLEADLTIIGATRLLLYAATDAPDVDFCVRLCDVFPDGRSRLLNTGALKGSHVKSHEHPEPLVAGEEHCFEIEIWAVANLFRAGHRIRVDIAASDFPFFECNPVASRSEIFHDSSRPSRLVLPVAGGPTSSLP
ncbi:MAG: putative esterase [Acidimicrobiia bacterium]|nr:putative esterase [Acidimicrobiia bacterium]